MGQFPTDIPVSSLPRYLELNHCNDMKELPWWLRGKEFACQAGDAGLIPWLGKCPGEENGNLLQCSCLGNPMDRGSWQATVCGTAEETNSSASKKQQQWYEKWIKHWPMSSTELNIWVSLPRSRKWSSNTLAKNTNREPVRGSARAPGGKDWRPKGSSLFLQPPPSVRPALSAQPRPWAHHPRGETLN